MPNFEELFKGFLATGILALPAMAAGAKWPGMGARIGMALLYSLPFLAVTPFLMGADAVFSGAAGHGPSGKGAAMGAKWALLGALLGFVAAWIGGWLRLRKDEADYRKLVRDREKLR